MASGSNLKHIFNNEQQSYTTHGTASQTKDVNVINIQLPYNPQVPTELDLWSGNFHPIFLHGSIEHIASDAKNIKDSLNFIARYISNKQMNSSKANDLEYFNSIGKSIWNFISSVYQTNWDSLYADNQSMTLRRKIVSKFTPKIVLTPGKNNKETVKHVPANIKKVPPPPLPILAKSKKEINVILKYFKGNKLTIKPKKSTMTYAQVSNQNASTFEVIKIKEAFLTIGTKKIDQINNIIKSTLKPKPCI